MDFGMSRRCSINVLASVMTVSTVSGVLASATPPGIEKEMLQDSGIAVNGAESLFRSKLFCGSLFSIIGIVVLGILVKYVIIPAYKEVRRKRLEEQRHLEEQRR